MKRCSRRFAPSPSRCTRRSAVGFGLLLATCAAQATTFVVNSTTDSGTGGCTVSECTLREAINASNTLTGADVIEFNIPGDPAGGHALALASPLPTISGGLDLNGYSEPGSVANSSASGFNAVIKIRLSGFALSGAAVGLDVRSRALVTIRGIQFTSFRSSGSGDTAAIVLGGRGPVSIRGCAIGVFSADGSAGNTYGVIVDADQSGTVNIGALGADAIASRNGFVDAGLDGVLIRNGEGTVNVNSNYIDSRENANAQTGHGVRVLRPATSIRDNLFSDNVVGALLQSAPFTVTGNVFQFNSVGVRVDTDLGGNSAIGGSGALANAFNNNAGDGIQHQSLQHAVDFSRNSFKLNGGLGIDLLGSDGVNSNDTGDGDSGPNALQNFPVLTAASRTTGNPTVTVAGTLNSLANRSFRLVFYGSAAADASGHGEGEFLGDSSVDVATDANGNGSFGPLQVNFNEGASAIAVVSASATLLDAVTAAPSATSELALSFPITTIVPTVALVVNSSADNGDGICDATCTLRDAILTANGNANPNSIDTIEFGIAGDVVHTIILAAALPALTEPVTIDGYTESGATANTDSSGVGSNAALRIHIRPPDASSMSLFSSGVQGMPASSVTLRGLAITGFNTPSLNGIRFAGSNVRIEGCWFGLRPDGSEALTSTSLVLGASSVFGGDVPAQRNIWINRSQVSLGTESVAINNLFGVRADGRTAAGTSLQVDDVALFLSPNGSGTRVERNVFSTPTGRHAVAAFRALILDNAFGESFDGVTPLPLGAALLILDGGVQLSSDTHAIRGATGGAAVAGSNCAAAAICFFALSENTPSIIDQPILGGSVRGISTDGSDHHASFRAPISGTGGLGIDLKGDGVNGNDAGDSDGGPNGMQNFPELLLAERGAGSVQVEGELNSVPDSEFRITFCGIASSHGSNHGGCDEVLGDDLLVTTDGNGFVAFSASLPDIGGHAFVTATASLVVSAEEERTSEFALNIAITDASVDIFADGFD